MGAVEALYMFDEHNTPILEHVYTGRPASASVLLPLYLARPSPRPSLMYLANVSPPTILHSLVQDRLLFLCPASADIEPLLVVEFLQRLTDALEDFLGAPLLASKIEASYDVVLQVAGEMCDAGIVCNTEPNALREVVEAPTTLGSLLGNLGLPSSAPVAPGRGSGSGFPTPSLQASTSATSASGSAIAWRRANVRHTSNELYVDIVEKLSVIMAPSGRPLTATASGTIAFTAKISGVPDLQLSLSAPGGVTGIRNAMDLPCFHPCVRLARWRDQPSELSFVPPDGRFVLAGYECNLLPDVFGLADGREKMATPSLKLPASIEVFPSLGVHGDELEVRLMLPLKGGGAVESLKTAGNGRFGTSSPAFGSSGNNASSMAPAVDGLVVSVPVPSLVRNVMELRSSRGEANYLPSEGVIEWRVSKSEADKIAGAGATLRCTMVGPADGEAAAAAASIKADGKGLSTDTYDYDEGTAASYQTASSNTESRPESRAESPTRQTPGARDQERALRNTGLMPGSCSLSFSVQGWLASGIKVTGLSVNAKTSKGLGAGVTPYKGVKYHTVSRRGIEVRC